MTSGPYGPSDPNRPPGQQPQYGDQPQYGQGYGDQPQYGQGYGGPPGYGGYGARPVAGRRLGVVGLVLAVAGAVLVIVAFTALDWFRNGKDGTLLEQAGKQSTFSEISDGYDKIKSQLRSAAGSQFVNDLHFGVGPKYFGWLGWVLLTAAVVLAALAVLPWSRSPIMRALGVVVAVAAIGLTFWAADLLRVSGGLKSRLAGQAPSYTDYLAHTSVGFWFAVGGFLLIGIGAALGPRRGTT